MVSTTQPMSCMAMVSMKRKREDNHEEDRTYTCKTCNKEFSSFQALGGHRASHNNRIKNDAVLASGDVVKRLHTCSYCFEKFVSGQALGGHMRKHRDDMEEKVKPFSSKKNKISENIQQDKKLKLSSDCDPDLVLRIEPIRSMFVEEKEKPGSPSSEVLDLESFKENKSLLLVDSSLVSDPIGGDNFVGEESRCSCGLKVVFMDFFSKKSDQVEKVPVEVVPVLEGVLEGDDSWLELTLGPRLQQR